MTDPSSDHPNRPVAFLTDLVFFFVPSPNFWGAHNIEFRQVFLSMGIGSVFGRLVGVPGDVPSPTSLSMSLPLLDVECVSRGRMIRKAVPRSTRQDTPKLRFATLEGWHEIRYPGRSLAELV